MIDNSAAVYMINNIWAKATLRLEVALLWKSRNFASL